MGDVVKVPLAPANSEKTMNLLKYIFTPILHRLSVWDVTAVAATWSIYSMYKTPATAVMCVILLVCCAGLSIIMENTVNGDD